LEKIKIPFKDGTDLFWKAQRESGGKGILYQWQLSFYNSKAIGFQVSCFKRARIGFI